MDSLYSGLSSNSFNQPDKRKPETIQRAQQRNKLLPAADTVLKAIDKEIESLTKIDFDNVKTLVFAAQPHSLEIDILAQEKAIEHMKSLRKNLENLLRDNKDAK